MTPTGSSARSQLDPATRVGLRRELLAWYRASRRPLPWRDTRDPYAIWISEAMLQQTRVETVEPYWRRFVERLPTIEALASASEDDVLALWSGLGYYRRARSLREAARAICELHGGRFPRDATQVRELPGVGPYTAGAVLSIAFGDAQPLVDGNVARVFARWFAIDGELESAAVKRELWELAAALVPDDGSAGDWNQALMELGATLCAPREPRCQACPVRERCRAAALGLTAELPRARRRPAPQPVALEALWVERDGRVLLERRPATGRMARLWQLPTIETSSPARLFPARHAGSAAFDVGEPIGEARHAITHHAIRATLRAARPIGLANDPPYRWFDRSELGLVGSTGLTRKLVALASARSIDSRGSADSRRSKRRRPVAMLPHDQELDGHRNAQRHA